MTGMVAELLHPIPAVGQQEPPRAPQSPGFLFWNAEPPVPLVQKVLIRWDRARNVSGSCLLREGIPVLWPPAFPQAPS